MNKLAERTAIIDAYVKARQQAGERLTGQEEQDFDWIADNLPRAAQLQRQGKLIRFYFLYGKLLNAAQAFITNYVPSEPRQ